MTIKYYFFGKECIIDRGLTDHSDLNKNLADQGFSSKYPAVFVKQVHGCEVWIIDNENSIPKTGLLPAADAIVTNLKNLIIGVVTADCTPILMFDDKAKITAAIHAGWRGAFANIASVAISNMVKMGAELENIHAIIGPTIRQKSYEISEEFYSNFLSENAANAKFFIPGKKDGHYLFDLPGYVKEKLRKDGIKYISDGEIDTYSNPKKMFSYRRSTHLGEKDCGRNVSVIIVNN